MDRKMPAVIGAITPALAMSFRPSRVSTHNLLRAAEVPHAVPLIFVPKVSGVIPSIISVDPDEPVANSHSTAYIAVADAEMIIELTTTAQS